MKLGGKNPIEDRHDNFPSNDQVNHNRTTLNLIVFVEWRHATARIGPEDELKDSKLKLDLIRDHSIRQLVKSILNTQHLDSIINSFIVDSANK